MRLVIKIDEETLQDIYDSRYVSPHIKEALRNGTPLPRGCGNLIDVNDLLEQIELEDTEENREENVGSIVTLEDLDRITPVIRAESEGKE